MISRTRLGHAGHIGLSSDFHLPHTVLRPKQGDQNNWSIRDTTRTSGPSHDSITIIDGIKRTHNTNLGAAMSEIVASVNPTMDDPFFSGSDNNSLVERV